MIWNQGFDNLVGCDTERLGGPLQIGCAGARETADLESAHLLCDGLHGAEITIARDREAGLDERQRAVDKVG